MFSGRRWRQWRVFVCVLRERRTFTGGYETNVAAAVGQPSKRLNPLPRRLTRGRGVMPVGGEDSRQEAQRERSCYQRQCSSTNL